MLGIKVGWKWCVDLISDIIFGNIQKLRFCKCRSAHIRHTNVIISNNVCIYIFAIYGQFVLVKG